MNIEISGETEARLLEAARKQGISVDELLARLLGEREASVRVAQDSAPSVPILHLGAMGPLHRRDIYDDVG